MRTLLYPQWLIDGTGAAPQLGQVVVVADGQIAQVAAAQDISARDTDMVMRFDDATLLPGLINNHVHLVLPGDNTPFMDIDKQSDAALALRAAHNASVSLRAGITTVRDCGARGTIALELREAQTRGIAGGARVISGAFPLTITGGHLRNFGGVADGADALRVMTRRVIGLGSDYVKVMASGGGTPGSLPNVPSYSADELRVISETAHALGRKVVAHCICTTAIENAIDAGVDCIEHAMFTTPSGGVQFDPRVADKLAQSGIVVTPTMQVFRDLRDLLPAGAERDAWARRNDAHRAVVGELLQRRVPILAGSDAGWRATAFDTFWKEIDELAISGMTPVQAIHAATGAVSQAWGYAEFGFIKAGQRADLLVVAGDAGRDVRCLQQVRAVWQRGQPIALSS